MKSPIIVDEAKSLRMGTRHLPAQCVEMKREKQEMPYEYK